MPNSAVPEPMLPGNYVLRESDIERIVAAVRGQSPSRDDMEEIAEKAVNRFLDRVGIDDIPGFRKDLTAMRSAREIRESLIKNGLGAVLTLLIGGIGTAIWLAIKGVK